jgi:DNA-binding NtrC family response regulator
MFIFHTFADRIIVLSIQMSNKSDYPKYKLLTPKKSLMKQGKILIVDDNKSVISALTIFLQFEFEQIQTISNPNRLLHELQATDFDIVLLDMNFTSGQNTGNEGLYWLRQIKKQYPDVEVVLFTAYGDVELAVKALKEGATDFVLKPWDNEKLLATLKATLRLRNSNLEITELKGKQKALKSEINRSAQLVIGQSAAMQKVMEMVKKVARTDANVLITGENGTGKEVIAREIHRISNRSNELFVTIDLAAITESLFESELHGHKKGSFTNAYEDRTGKLALAHKGSLFLDEIGNIPLHLQSKLLTVLQTRMVTPVGSNKEIPVDIRLICATNKDLDQMVAANLFRQDLLYRINTIHIHLPPLRERPEDIADLTNFFMEQYGKKYDKPGLKINSRTLDKLRAFTWYGNIRELQHAIEKAVILCDEDILSADYFHFSQPAASYAETPETLDDMEKKLILNTMKKHNQNMSAVALQLGITRQTLYNKLKKYGY